MRMFSNKIVGAVKHIYKLRFLSDYNQTEVRELFVLCLTNLLEILLYIHYIWQAIAVGKSQVLKETHT